MVNCIMKKSRKIFIVETRQSSDYQTMLKDLFLTDDFNSTQEYVNQNLDIHDGPNWHFVVCVAELNNLNNSTEYYCSYTCEGVYIEEQPFYL